MLGTVGLPFGKRVGSIQYTRSLALCHTKRGTSRNAPNTMDGSHTTNGHTTNHVKIKEKEIEYCTARRKTAPAPVVFLPLVLLLLFRAPSPNESAASDDESKACLIDESKACLIPPKSRTYGSTKCMHTADHSTDQLRQIKNTAPAKKSRRVSLCSTCEPYLHSPPNSAGSHML